MRTSVHTISVPEPGVGGLARLYFPLLACACGAFVFAGIAWLIPVYFALAYIVVSATVFSVTQAWRDYLNPLLLIMAAGFIRFSLPGFLAFINHDPEVEMFAIMGLESRDWILGHALALIGFLGVIIGWLFRFEVFAALLRRVKVINMRHSAAVPHAAMLAMLFGLAALIMFVRSNVSFEDALYSGEMRGAEVRPGTGKYFHLSLMFIAGSVVFTSYLINRNYAWWKTLLPTFITSACFVILGGRVRAFLPIAAGLVMLWYRRDELKFPVLVVAGLAVVLPIFSFVVQLYRGLGVEGVRELFSLATLAEYVEYAVWADWGQLHGLAGAVVIGPGVLEGRTFVSLLWPLSKILDLPTQSAGILIAERLFGFAGKKFSFHAALIGDAYLNFGLIGVVIVTVIFGAIVKELYARMRHGQVNKAIYALFLVYSMRIFFEGVEEYGEMLMVLIFAVSVLHFAEILKVARRHA